MLLMTKELLCAARRRVLGCLLVLLAGLFGPLNFAAAQANPAQGPGGPILVITSPSATFGKYYAEILRNEGLNSFFVVDVGSVTPALLASYDIAILAKMSLSSGTVTTLTDWVTAGGNLIAMDPDPLLASLVGISTTGTTLQNGYLRVDTSTRAGNGIINQTMQFHGSASRYTLGSASALATLYATASTSTNSPAVTLRDVGSNNGTVAAFAYDLATSIVYTRQGNPAWAGQERDGIAPRRSNDMFFGNAATDPQPDWVDKNKISIPQADEQMRFFGNLIREMSLDRKPLPRFWYLPKGHRAAIVMTGDDHSNGGTIGRFNQFIGASPAGCSVDDWECVRGTSYVFPTTPISDAQAASFNSMGFEIGLHVNTDTGCADYTQQSLGTIYDAQISQFQAAYPSLPPLKTERHHCIVWSDWASGAKVELAHGVRLDTNYYYWPAGWVNNIPGHFTGSAMPMRFADLDGTLIDVYQAVTQMTDESSQTYPFTVETLLDRAIGPDEQYGVYTINAHTDVAQIVESDSTLAAALERDVPIVSARQMLTWLDGRNSSYFSGLSWNSNVLSFQVVAAAGANGLQGLVPRYSFTGVLSTIKRGATDVGYEVVTIKGAEYAGFPATAGAYTATYLVNTTPPAITSFTPANGATSVPVGTQITARFSKALDPASVTSSTVQLRDAANVVVPATISYSPATLTVTIAPTSWLSLATTYTVRIEGGATAPTIKDLSGTPLTADFAWSFTTSAELGNCPCMTWDDAVVPTITSVTDDSSPLELGVKFRSTTAGYIAGVRFYKGALNTGTHVGSLWTATGQRLATAIFTNESSTGWQSVYFATPVAITANTVYVASYFAPTGGYAADNNYFASGVDRDMIHLLSDAEAGGNGVFAYGGSSTFPTSSWQATNYWVDVIFSTSNTPPPDTVAPTLVGQTPSSGATGVSLSGAVTATFSEEMDPATISSSTFELRSATNQLIPATVTYTDKKATLKPTAPLAGASTFTATIKGGATAPQVKDLAGNALAASVSWSFTTQSGTCPCSIWPSSAVPQVASDSETSSVELGVKFKSDVSGFISAIRFYKGSSNTGTHVGKLWSSSGQLLASATFTNETAQGWQQVNFASPVAIAANTTYVASYFAPNGGYAFDSNYFINGVDNVVLHAPSNAAGGGNGVYEYGAGNVFPSSTFGSANYWVDVVFNTSSSTGPDTVPPTVISRSPGSGAANVPVNSPVTIGFSEIMSAASINSTTVALRTSGGTLVPATVSYSGSTASLLPSAALASSQGYTVTVLGGSSGVKDAAGNAMSANEVWSFVTAAPGGPCAANSITAENCLTGNPASEWDVDGAGDTSIQGFATQISVNRGSTVSFKVKTTATSYRFDIYRMGYYGGLGARKVASVTPSASLPQNQPSCLTQASTGLIDCGNWAVSGSWAVPANAVSGIYFAKLVRADTGGASHIVFIVRNDSSTADLVFQTSDTTWQAYNNYGGNSLYVGSPGTNPSRAYKVSYNRPFNTRAVDGAQDWVFNAEYPMVRWLEANGYEVSYISGVDTDRTASLLLNHRAFLSVGHDEYWSGQQRANVEAARNSGVNLAFFSGNEVFWKVRWENSIDGSGTAYRTLVSYKETHAGAKIDPSAEWTGSWRDPRFSPPADGGKPENALTGTIFTVNSGTSAIVVPAAEGKMRFWRNTSVATLSAGQTATLPDGTLGYEWDSDLDNGSRPAGLIRLSDTTVSGVDKLVDYGSSYVSSTSNHALTFYKHSSGARVFGAGTIQWSWGLDANHDRGGTPVDARMQQATVNLFADMNAQPATLQAGLTTATASTDAVAPTIVITSPTAGGSVLQTAATITGTAADAAGVVASVEVSVDGGVTWHRATGRANWSYTWTPPAGPATVRVRAVDDSGNLSGVPTTVSFTVTAPPCPCSIWPATSPTSAADADSGSVELGTRFRSTSAGVITAIRFYKAAQNTGTHVGSLWSANGDLLGQVTFTGETSSGWQTAQLPTAVAIQANTWYVVSYHTSSGFYNGEDFYFADNGVISGPLQAARDGDGGANGLFGYSASSAFPTETYRSENYWVDVVFNNSGSGTDTTAPIVTITLPTNVATFAAGTTPLTLSGTASDTVGVTQVSWSNSAGGSGTATGTTSWSVSGIVLQPGSNVLTVTARDAAGNSSTDTLTVTYTADTTAPTVTIATPTSAATFATSSSPMTLGGTASDAVGVTQVTWSNSRGGSGTASGTTSWSASGITLQSGSNLLTVTARDAGGNSSTDTLTVTYTLPDTTAPVITIATPTNATTFSTSGSTVALGGAATDAVGVTQVTWSNSRGGSGTATGTTSWTASNIALQTGSNVITVTARDAAGNSSSDTLTVTRDATAPSVAITTPTTSNTFSTTVSSLPIGGTSSDAVGVTQVTWSSSRGVSGTASGTTAWSSNVSLVSGTNVITVTARDAAGNTATDILTVTYTPDVTAPTITITSPTSATTFVTTSSSLALSGSASDSVGVTLVSWSNSRGGSGNASGTGSWSVSSIPLLSGANILTVTARDAAGNTSVDTLTVTRDNTAPTVAITGPTSLATFSTTQSSISLSGTAADSVGVTQVTWTNSRGGSGTASGTTSWSASAISLLAGSNVLTVTARDAAGNTNTDTLTVTRN